LNASKVKSQAWLIGRPLYFFGLVLAGVLFLVPEAIEAAEILLAEREKKG